MAFFCLMTLLRVKFDNSSLFSTRHSTNLRDNLVKTDIYLLNLKNELLCSALIKGHHSSHPHTGKKTKITNRITCVRLYLLKCPCRFCYVGKTEIKVIMKISEQKSNIRNIDERSPKARYFLVCSTAPHHGDWSSWVVEKRTWWGM